MLQRSFEITKPASLKRILKFIAGMEEYKTAKDRLLIVFEPQCEREFIEKELDVIRKELPEAKIAGMTTLGTLSAETEVPQNTVISILLFSKSTLAVFEADKSKQDPYKIGDSFRQKLRKLEDVKGILCLSSCTHNSPDKIIDIAQVGSENIPIFGAQAGSRFITQDESKIFSENGILENGISFVAFCGKSLEIQTDFNLGWRALGREHVITECQKGIVSEIDGKPAFDLYQKYLQFKPDADFSKQAIAFPILVPSGSTFIAKVPLRLTDDGNLCFPTDFQNGTKIYLAYSKPEYLLSETLVAANNMLRFHPEATVLFPCINRRVFLGNERAEKEFEFYRHSVSELCWGYGFGEILQTNEGGGVLNSSLVAVGFRESAKSKKRFVPIDDESIRHAQNNLSLADRLVSFLEATSDELRHTINQLANLAEHDQLTGLFNRHKLDKILLYELGKRRREDELSILMYDIDFFKNVNDSYGHSEGDRVLAKLSNLVAESIRACDVLGRWGGEEFVCILTNTPLNGAKILAERIREKVESTDFSPVPKVTISLGITAARINETPESLFIRLDKALYDAKKSGRNRTCIR